MSDSTVAQRYAGALFDLAASQGSLERVDADLAMVASTLGEHPDLAMFLDSPIVATEDAKTVIRQLLESKIEPLTFNTICLMVDKQRGGHLARLAAVFRERFDRHQRRVQVRVTSAMPLDETEQGNLSRALAKATAREIKMEVAVDDGLIGGLVVTIGDQVIDGSIRGQLEALARTLA